MDGAYARLTAPKMRPRSLATDMGARSLTGTFGKTEITVPRARLERADGKTTEWKSQALRAYQRRTVAADAVIAGTYLAGTNTRRVRRALAALFGGAIGKDTVSRVWRKVKRDWDAWNARPLADEPIVRLILDGTVVRVRLDRKATSISLLVVIDVRPDGQKLLLAVKGRTPGERTSRIFPGIRRASSRFVLPILAECALCRTGKSLCYHRIFWSGRWDSNRRPQPWQGAPRPQPRRSGTTSAPLFPLSARVIARAIRRAAISAVARSGSSATWA
jgi:hypothetical protein